MPARWWANDLLLNLYTIKSIINIWQSARAENRPVNSPPKTAGHRTRDQGSVPADTRSRECPLPRMTGRQRGNIEFVLWGTQVHRSNLLVK
jgi:hypothetical protein